MITTEFNEDKGILTLTLDQDLLSSNAESSQTAFEKALARAPKYKGFRIDLCQAKVVDSVGLNLLFGLLHRAQELGAEPCVVVTRGPLERIMQVARIDKIFKVEIKEPATTPIVNPKIRTKKP